VDKCPRFSRLVVFFLLEIRVKWLFVKTAAPFKCYSKSKILEDYFQDENDFPFAPMHQIIVLGSSFK